MEQEPLREKYPRLYIKAADCQVISQSVIVQREDVQVQRAFYVYGMTTDSR